MQNKNVNLRETFDQKLEQVNLNDPDELEAQLDLLDVVRSSRPESPKKRPKCRVVCCRALICIVVLVPFLVALLVVHLKGDNAQEQESFAPLQPPPANLKSTCANKTISNDEKLMEECKQACEVAECCGFPANMALSCLTGNEKTCLEYRASCSILDNATLDMAVQESIPPAPSIIWQVCEPENLATSEGLLKCQTICQSARCCYDKDVSPSCTTQHLACQEYAPCLNLAATNHIHQDIVEEIEAKCLSKRSLEGRNECQQACSHATCCFNGTYPCLHDTTDWCDQYEACSSAMTEKDTNRKEPSDMQDKDSGTEQTDTQQDTYNDKDNVAAQIRQACVDSPDATLCLELCQPGECCFSHQGCDNQDCIVYTPCFVNHDNDDDMDMLNMEAVAIAKACHNSTWGNVDTTCAAMCQASKCCFVPDYCDEPTRVMNCDKYASCYVLYGEDGDSPTTHQVAPIDEYNDSNDSIDKAPEETIAEACAGSSPGNVDPQCEIECEIAKCCFASSDCNDGILCEQYTSCGVLYVTDDDDVVQD